MISNHSTTEEGFRALMSKYQRDLYFHIKQYLNDHNDVDDVLQNTFVKVYRHIAAFNGDSKLYTWLYRIATNETITFLKVKNRKPTNEWQENDDARWEEQIENGELIQQKLHEAVECLPEKQKLVFNLRYFEEKSYKEISDMLGTSEGALKASYHFAVKKIEHTLTQ